MVRTDGRLWRLALDRARPGLLSIADFSSCPARTLHAAC
jgi:hypothetical protein